jgi:hypothetical protein
MAWWLTQKLKVAEGRNPVSSRKPGGQNGQRQGDVPSTEPKLLAVLQLRSGLHPKRLYRVKPLSLFFLGDERHSYLAPQAPDHATLFSDGGVAVDEKSKLIWNIGGLTEKPSPAL